VWLLALAIAQAESMCPVVYPAAEANSGISVELRATVSNAPDGGTQFLFEPEAPSAAFEAAARQAALACATPVWPVTVRLTFVAPARPWTLAGEVVGEWGQPIAGASVTLESFHTTTDDRGRFSLVIPTLPPTDTWVRVEAEGLSANAFPQVFEAGRTTQVRYVMVLRKGYETRVRGSRLLAAVPDADRSPQVSRTSISRADVERSPGALEDISRVVMQLPGVAADPDLLAQFFVRGGGPEETLFVLDGVPLSNPYHLGGFASIINPLLIDSAEFYGGASPARYEPSLSGTLDVRYSRADVKRTKVLADVSLLSAKASVETPLGVEGLTAVASFRRSYLELYFAILKAFRLFGQSVVAPDITEGFARVAYRRGIHRVMLSFLHASDGFNFVVKPGEEVLINFAGNLRLANSLQMLGLRYEADLAGDSEASATVAYVRDENVFDVQSARSTFSQGLRHEVVARADWKQVLTKAHRFSTGLQYAWRTYTQAGVVTDPRAVAPWAREPIVDAFRPTLPISPSLTRRLLSAYLEDTLQLAPSLATDLSFRGQYDFARRQLSGSSRLAAAVTLPSLTVLKASIGGVLVPVQGTVPLDATFGTPSLSPERTLQLIGAVEQPLPFEALLRIEGWAKWLDGLVVNPDTPAALEARLAQGLPAYENAGFGFAAGAEALLVGRFRTLGYTVGVGGLSARRTNPLAAGVATYHVQWEQQFTAGTTVSWSPNRAWLVTARANIRTGRPYTPVRSFTVDRLNARYVPEFGTTSSERYPFFLEVSARGEHRFVWGPLTCAFYLEVLNLTNTMNVFSWVYGPGDITKDIEPTRGRFTHLPIRPFFGFRVEY
jgi:hypothetical protein